MDTKTLGAGVYEVGSDTSSRAYIVNLNNDPASCTCTAWAIARNRAARDGQPAPPCKHIRRVEEEHCTVEDLKDLLASLDGREPGAKAPEPAVEKVFVVPVHVHVIAADADQASEILAEALGPDAPLHLRTDHGEFSAFYANLPGDGSCGDAQHVYDIPADELAGRQNKP